MAIAIVGLDLAKHVFQVHAVDETGRAVLRRQLRRAGVEAFFKILPSASSALRHVPPPITGLDGFRRWAMRCG